ncbi:unnamed protein product [Ambrosiozyma monospora]|uniref:Unnamed protein product n=1 Tax=Ambrosiozyma monospora TaxID=43982 RepID=A0ACB5SUN0_AMBMO|nr:unnamed protein product [Ambrosiozyma monospora]
MTKNINTRTVGIIDLTERDSLIIDLLPSNETRSSIARELIRAYELNSPTKHPNVQLIPYYQTTASHLTKFHSPQYIEELLKERDWSEHLNPLSKTQTKTLSKLQTQHGLDIQTRPKNTHKHVDPDDSDEEVEDELSKFGLKFDCPVFPFLNRYIELTAGTSLAAANWLLKQHKAAEPESQQSTTDTPELQKDTIQDKNELQTPSSPTEQQPEESKQPQLQQKQKQSIAINWTGG